MREKVNGFVGVMAVSILCMVSGLCMVWGIAPVVLAVYVAACAVCGRYMITCIGWRSRSRIYGHSRAVARR